MTGTPVGSPFPTASYPYVTYVTLSAGLLAAGNFAMYVSLQANICT